MSERILIWWPTGDQKDHHKVTRFPAELVGILMATGIIFNDSCGLPSYKLVGPARSDPHTFLLFQAVVDEWREAHG